MGMMLHRHTVEVVDTKKTPVVEQPKIVKDVIEKVVKKPTKMNK